VKFIKTILFGCETPSPIAVLTLYAGFHTFSITILISLPSVKERIHSTFHPKWEMHSWHHLADEMEYVLGNQPGTQWGQGRLCCGIFGRPARHKASVGPMHNLRTILVTRDSTGDASWLHMHVYRTYKTYSDYCIFKITNVPWLDDASCYYSVYIHRLWVWLSLLFRHLMIFPAISFTIT